MSMRKSFGQTGEGPPAQWSAARDPLSRSGKPSAQCYKAATRPTRSVSQHQTAAMRPTLPNLHGSGILVPTRRQTQKGAQSRSPDAAGLAWRSPRGPP
jgi:hypothetical protein